MAWDPIRDEFVLFLVDVVVWRTLSEAEGSVDAQVEVAHGRLRVVGGARPDGEPNVGRHAEALVDDVEQQRQARHGGADRTQIVRVHLQFHLPHPQTRKANKHTRIRAEQNR